MDHICAICTSPMVSTAITCRLECTHRFHSLCIHGLELTQQHCPTCNESLECSEQHSGMLLKCLAANARIKIGQYQTEIAAHQCLHVLTQMEKLACCEYNEHWNPFGMPSRRQQQRRRSSHRQNKKHQPFRDFSHRRRR